MARIKWTKKFYQEVFTAFSITLSPFILFLHTFFDPDARVLNLFLFEYHHGFNGNDTFVWYILKRLIPVVLLIYWYFTSRMRWHNFILIVIAPFVFALVSVFNISFIRTNDLLMGYFLSGAISITTIPTLYLLKIYVISPNPFMSNSTSQYFVNIRNLKKQYKRLQLSIDSLKKRREEIKSRSYLSRLYYNKDFIRNTLLNNSPFSPLVYPKINFFDILFCTLLAITPIVFFAYTLIPDGLSEYKILFFTIQKKGFKDAGFFVWYLGQLICFVIPLCIWFIVENSWWRFALLSPLVVTIYNIGEGISSEARFLDEVEYLKAAPFVISLVVLLVLLSYIVRMKYKLLNLYEWLRMEIDMLLSLTSSNSMMAIDFKNVKETYMNDNNKMTDEKYYEHLLSIREKLLVELTEVPDKNRETNMGFDE